MRIDKVFILMILEVGSFMLLWSKFNDKHEKMLYKSAFIVLLTSLIAVLTTYIYPAVQFIINYLFLLLFIKIIFKRSTKHLLLGFGLILAIFAVIQIAVIMLLRLSVPNLMMRDNFLALLIANLIFMLFSFCIYKYVSYGKLILFYQQEKFKIYFLSINLFLYIVFLKWIWNFNRYEFLDHIALYLAIPVLFILANLFYLEYQIKNIETKKSLEDYKKYSPVITSLLDDVRRRQHDFKNHLNTVYSLVLVTDQNNLKDTLTQYINSLNASVENIERVLQIDNTVVTAIIYNKVNEAEKNNIEFKYTIQGDYKYPFKDYELSEILNSLLDNAFDAVLELKSDMKKVFLNIGYLEDNCILEIGNVGQRIGFDAIGRIFEAGYSTKRGENRGYGLYNVKKIVESYGGRIQLSFENNYTTFSIMLF